MRNDKQQVSKVSNKINQHYLKQLVALQNQYKNCRQSMSETELKQLNEDIEELQQIITKTRSQ